MRELTFGFSPCPNDTFAFHALVHGLVDTPFRVRPVLLDIEELNVAAREARFDVTKLSVGAMPSAPRYRMLRSGAALGHGVGPLVVARSELSLADAVAGRLAIPGKQTTAFMLLRLLGGEPADAVELRFDLILDAVAQGEYDAGLIIHESRFTYADHGLVRVADLGELWEARTSLPVPLATICARDDVAERDEIEAAIRRSVEYAFAHPQASTEYVAAHSQEMSPEVCRQHIVLYVMVFSIDIGDAVLAAFEALRAAVPA
jgi:1,4-dihydroxy-6-naphthoate synthase